ncbi:restriction endonuclease subunit S [ANME-1 cluster archaeon AG-394-G21]|nr:restriction endonuclease subunit S [ANME-1 cluster archaeon AG-394-G21]
MKLKPYPKYIDSGIQWIGKIPEGWEVRKLKFISRLFGRIGFRGYTVSDLVEEGKGALAIGGKHISKNQKLDLSSPEYLSWEKYKESPEIMIEQGNILITQRGTLGKVVLIDKDIGPATINPSMILIKEIKLLSEYLYYFLVSDFSIQEVALINSQTAVPMISQEQADNFHIIFPRNEQIQTAITSFLDKQNAKIDVLIEKDKKLIALLKEKRTTLINHAVTKGLDPNVKLKDSDIPWIGEIPERWEIHRQKFLVSKINSGITPKGGAEVYEEDGIPLLRSQNIHFDGLKLEDVAFIPEKIHKTMLNCVVKKHDVLINITGASIGRCSHVEDEFEKANVNQHVCIIRPKNVYYKFLSYFLSSRLGQDQVFSIQMGSSKEGLNFEQLGNFIILVPLKQEQQKIANFLDKATSKIDKTIKKIEEKIKLLEEYKKSLIHHVVTGKVDVRKSEV